MKSRRQAVKIYNSTNNMSSTEKKELIERVDAALDDVRPHLAVDGGNVEVIDVTDDHIVKIKWLGTCKDCTMSGMTMKAGVEQAIKGRIPEVSSVEAINGVKADM
jgi:Fe-S cluster biogenesis protein NfuA